MSSLSSEPEPLSFEKVTIVSDRPRDLTDERDLALAGRPKGEVEPERSITLEANLAALIVFEIVTASAKVMA